MRKVLALAWLFGAGCASAPKADADVSGDTGSDSGWSDCGVLLEATEPAAGAVDHLYWDPIVFELTDADLTATIEAPVPGTLTRSPYGETLTFTPDPPLAPSTDYTFRVEWCDGAVDLSFHTSDLGSSPVDPSLVGRSYEVALVDGEPRSVMGMELLAYLVSDLLVAVTEDRGGELDLLVTRSVEDASGQDYCVATDTVLADFSGDPWFDAGSVDVAFTYLGYDAPFHRARLTGTFAPDGAWFAGGTLDAVVDTRYLAALVAESDPGAACDSAAADGAFCVPCPDGEPYCLPLMIDRLEGYEVPDMLVPIPAPDCAGCASGPPAVCP